MLIRTRRVALYSSDEQLAVNRSHMLDWGIHRDHMETVCIKNKRSTLPAG